MSLDSFVGALNALTPVSYGNVTRIAQLDPSFRAQALLLAARHEVDLVSADRYDATAYVERESLRLVSKYPVRAATLALAHVMLDWDARLVAGEPVEQLHSRLSGFEPDEPYTGVADLASVGLRDDRNEWARQCTGISDPGPWEILVRLALTGAAHAWLVAGDYGTDPQAADSTHDTLACLLADNGGAADRNVGVAAENAVKHLHLARGVTALVASPTRALARPATGGEREWGRA